MRKLATAVLAAINCFLFSIAVSAAPYVVKAGDTMWLIAKTHGMTIEELILANPDITDPSNIWPGLTLNIPDENTPDDENGNYASEGKESLTFLYAGNTVSYLKIIDTAQNSLNTICPDYFDIDANGNLWITPSNKIDPEFIANIHERRIRITPFISNHWDKAKGNAALNNMEALTDQIANAIDVYNLDGVNIDIENVSEEYRNAYSKFTRLLRGKLPANKIVSVAAAANPNGWNTGWHGSYDYKALSDYSDYLMIMAYDESYAGGSAGPISSKAFFENSIKYALNKGVPKEKIVVGIPFFGRYWKAGDAVGGNAVTASDVEFLTANYESVKRYDTARESANVTVTIKPGEPEPKLWGGRILTAGVYDIWYDDLHAVKFKLDLIRQYGVKGAGSWALGQENTEMWRYYLDALNGGSTATPTATITPTPTNTFTPTPTVSITPTPTNTFTPTPANTLTPTPTVSITLTPTVSITPTP
ncbi:MAG: LysM peptidoglycan-binding domain-containing protein, partial [Clostridiales bacterium]|nr:LysM peptidoglycan-binding domain-containing protein [Clostridiales bacterium]